MGRNSMSSNNISTLNKGPNKLGVNLMKTLVEQFMEKEGKQMPKTFKTMDLDKWVQWRQGKERNLEFEEWAKDG